MVGTDELNCKTIHAVNQNKPTSAKKKPSLVAIEATFDSTVNRN
jgi:hypothetical protein